jgi:predicted O-methyltransferase YrrM
MNPVLAEIFRTRMVRLPDGASRPLESEVSEEEGAYLAALVEELRPTTSLEIGLACGVSALFICEALAKNGAGRHIAIDPGQLTAIPSDDWQGIGLSNLERAGYRQLVDFRNSPSEIELPRLLEQGVRIQFAFVDGWHTFDHAMVDFFYINRLLEVGGLVAFDDADLPQIAKLLQFIATLPAYAFHGAAGFRRAFLPHRLAGRAVQGTARLLGKNRPLVWPQAVPERWRLRLQKGTLVAMRKIAADERGWSWHAPF